MVVSRSPASLAPPPVPGSALLPGQSLPACTDTCRSYRVLFIGTRTPCETIIHDPAVHEAWGRRLMGERAHGLVRTGPLVIDLDRCTLTMRGRSVPLTMKETQIILILASRLDYVVPYYNLLVEVWGPGYVPEFGEALRSETMEIHLLRVHAARLRKKLGDAAGLIQTQMGVGLRLVVVQPEATEDVQEGCVS